MFSGTCTGLLTKSKVTGLFFFFNYISDVQSYPSTSATIYINQAKRKLIKTIEPHTLNTTMAKLIKTNGIVKFKTVVKKLQKSLLLGRKWNFYSDEENRDSTHVPQDVKEGHVPVLAVDGDEPKRFIVPLNCLTHPAFMTLLEKAAEEYGFDCEGPLTIPCRPSELEIILAEKYQEAPKWSSGDPMLQTY